MHLQYVVEMCSKRCCWRQEKLADIYARCVLLSIIYRFPQLFGGLNGLQSRTNNILTNVQLGVGKRALWFPVSLFASVSDIYFFRFTSDICTLFCRRHKGENMTVTIILSEAQSKRVVQYITLHWDSLYWSVAYYGWSAMIMQMHGTWINTWTIEQLCK